MTQKAAVVHILLDIASENDSSKKESKNLQEIQCLICCFIHEMFIEEEALCKLIHFQGYSLSGLRFINDFKPTNFSLTIISILKKPKKAQEMLVKGVPSMHICIGFLPELFKIATLEQRVFGIRLLGHLAHQYSIPRTLEICKLALHIGLTLSQGNKLIILKAKMTICSRDRKIPKNLG